MGYSPPGCKESDTTERLHFTSSLQTEKYKTAKWLSEEALQIAMKRRESESEVTQSCPTLCDPTDYITCQAPLSMEFSG